jgi:hypothetical protein
VKKLLSISVLALAGLGLSAQNNTAIEKEKQYIKSMCGCYEVDFLYAETFSDNPDYEFHDRYSAHGLVWIFVEEEQANKLVLQHLLVINDSTIIKHWRQDWLYENQSLLTYQKNLEWERKVLSEAQARGTWTQKVFQVDDSPRYEGYATWVDVDDKRYWESQIYAPLPRREFTKRNDYNVMLRTNKHRITDYGHVHELDNAKVLRTAQRDSVLVWEKGMNRYTKVDDSRCQLAVEWWQGNRHYWADVRSVWDKLLLDADYVNLTMVVEDKKLWQRLFALNQDFSDPDQYQAEVAQSQIKEIIKEHLSDQPGEWRAAAN